MDYVSYAPSEAANQVSAGGIIVWIVVFLAIYLYTSYCLQKIAQKTNTPNDWLAWIPVINIVLMVQIAKLSLWWIVGLFIPIINIGVAVYIWWKIAENLRRPGWWGILMLIGPINLILLYFMAFKDPAVPSSIPTQNTPTM